MKKLFFSIIMIGCVSMACLSGCGRKAPEQTKPARIKIGAVIPLTGEVATYGESLKKGFEIAQAEFGGEFVVICEDSKGDPTTGITAFRKLLATDKVVALLGDATSGVCKGLAPVAEQERCLMMISIATSDDLRTAGDYIFRNAPANRAQAITAADYIQKNFADGKVALLHKQNPYGTNLGNVFREESKRRQMELVLDDKYAESTRDFTDIVGRLKDSGATVVFVPGNYEETAGLLRRARELECKVKFVGTDGAYSPKLMELAGAAAEGFVLTMMAVDSNVQLTKAFNQKFEVKFAAKPDVFCSYGYEGARILMTALRQAGGNADAAKAFLYANSFDSLTGPLRFDKDGEVERAYGLLVVRDGAFRDLR